ncbi:hypothetical protein HPP92_018115 [Vanilla planifolia]|uniref:Uncharacterized protein n=1 Tax=Vanilla planifolia TaxID=51239 RepID=A0A835Q557_VANPL|nr:hypothetical protein HPP92_018115 [Vanilla planifolia]
MTTDAGGLDLNCETATVVEEKEVVGEAKGLKGSQRGVGGRGAAAELGKGSEEDGQMKSFGWELGEVVNRREGLERVIGKDNDSIAVLVGGGVFDDKKLEESSLSNKDLSELQHGPVADCIQTAYAEFAQSTRRSEVEFDGGKFLGANSTENEEKFPVFSYDFGSSESNSQAMDMEDRHGGEQTQQNGVHEDDFRANSKSVAMTVGIRGPKNETLERSIILDKKECKTQAQSLDRCAKVVGSEIEAGKRKAEPELHDGNLLVLNEEEEALVHLVAILDEDFEIPGCTQSMQSGDIQKGETDVESVFRKDEDIAAGSNSVKLLNTNMGGNENPELVSFSAQGFEAFEASSPPMVLQGQINDDKMGGTILDAEAVVGTNGVSVNVSASGGVPDKERGKSSTLLVAQLIKGTSGSVCVNDFCESNNIEGSVIDAVSYSGQVHKAIVSDHHGRGYHSEAADMLERKREASITISVDGVSKDEILESSCSSEGNLAVSKEDGNESVLTEKRVAKPEESEGVWLDMARLTGDAEGTVYHMDVQSPEFEEGDSGNQKVISCGMGVVAVDCVEAEVQLVEASHRSDSGQEEADFDVTEMTEKSPLSLESDGTVKNRRVCDFVVGHPAYREGEGGSCHSQAEEGDDLSAGQASQGALPESMIEETGMDVTQEEPIVVNRKIYGEHYALTGESLHMNSVIISTVQSLGSQQLDTVISCNAKTLVGMDEVTNMGASSADMHNLDEIIVKDKD